MVQFSKKEGKHDKFQDFVFGKQTHDVYSTFSLGEVKVTCDETVKPLGVEINFLFIDQIAKMYRKAAVQPNVLLRMSKFRNTNNKILVNKSFIRSSLNHCSHVWHFCYNTYA